MLVFHQNNLRFAINTDCDDILAIIEKINTVFSGRRKIFGNILSIGGKTPAIIKIYNDSELLFAEEKKLDKLQGLAVPKIYATVYGFNHGIMIMERLSGRDLFEYTKSIGSLTEKVVRNIASQLLVIVYGMKFRGISHYDIKLENIVYDARRKIVHLIDFEQRMTPDYISPEYASEGILESAYDVWSIGLVLLFCLTGRAPFKNPKKYIGICRRKCTGDCVELLEKMLNEDWTKRITIESALQHSWIGKSI